VVGVALVDLEIFVLFAEEIIDRIHDIVELDVGYSCGRRIACLYRDRIMLRTNIHPDFTVSYIFLMPRLS
jgi:hypothetical protein